MFGRKTRELRFMLDQQLEENEILRKRINELEKEVAALKEQEASVARAITEAGKAAARIEQEADSKRNELIEKAEATVKEANENAEAVIARANDEASVVRKAADEYRVAQKRDADNYAENTRTDVNIYVERSILASQMEVRKRKEVAAQLNDLLKKTTDYLTEQNNLFIEMLSSVIEDNDEQVGSLCSEVEKCSCSCKDCANPCENKKDEDETAPDEAAQAETAEDETQDEASETDEDIDPAKLMQNIYKILKRQLPDAEKIQPAPSEKTDASNPEKDQPVIRIVPQKQSASEKIESQLPHDSDLSELVSDVI